MNVIRTISAPASLGLAAVLIVAACSGGSPAPSSSAADPSTPPTQVSHVALTIATGNDVTIEIDDASGLLRDAASGTPGDGASVAPYEVVVTNDGPSTLRLTWTGGPCDADDLLRIDRTGRNLLLVEPECPGDAVGYDRVLLLHLTSPIDAAEVHAVLQDGLDTPA